MVTRELTAPVHRNVAVVVRRGSLPRAAVDAVVEALLDHPAIPALAAPVTRTKVATSIQLKTSRPPASTR